MTVYILQPVGLSGRMMMIKLEISFLCFPVETTSGAASSQWPWRQEREAEPWIINDNIQPVPSLDIKHSGSVNCQDCQLYSQLFQDTLSLHYGLEMLTRRIKSPPM